MGPFVVVEVAGSQVTVRLRPKFLARLLAVAPLIAEPGNGLTVTVKQGRPWGWYIEFQLSDRPPYSFMAESRGEAQWVLSCLEDAGFEVPDL